MPEHELELAIGDVLVIGDYTVTVVDVDGPEVSFRIEDPESTTGEFSLAQNEQRWPRPR